MKGSERRSSVGRSSLAGILREMYEAGEFEVAVLATGEGLPIATVPREHKSEMAAAMVALVQKVSKEAQGQLGMAEVDEVMIRDEERVRLVTRNVVVGEEELILAAMVPPDHYYRRVTNKAIKRIQQMLG